MNATQKMTIAFSLAAFLGTGLQSFAAEPPPCCEIPMTQEQKNNVQQSLFKIYADTLQSPSGNPHDVFMAVRKIRELALVNSEVATDAVPLLVKFQKTPSIRIPFPESESIERLINDAIKEISDRWEIMKADQPSTVKKNTPKMSGELPAAPPCCIMPDLTQ